jgi:small-conductance mechanosensitive channel
MYREQIQEKDHDMSDAIHQPELASIIEKLQSVVNRYDGIICETKGKLQTIKRYNEPPITLSEAGKQNQPETVTEEINRLLFRLNDLNEKAEENLRHLKEIV